MATSHRCTQAYHPCKFHPFIAPAEATLIERDALPVIPTIFVDRVKTYGHRPTRRWRFCSRHHCPELNAVLGALTHNRVRTYSLIRVSTCIRWASRLQTFVAAALEIRSNNGSAAANLLIIVIGFKRAVDQGLVWTFSVLRLL